MCVSLIMSVIPLTKVTVPLCKVTPTSNTYVRLICVSKVNRKYITDTSMLTALVAHKYSNIRSLETMHT